MDDGSAVEFLSTNSGDPWFDDHKQDLFALFPPDTEKNEKLRSWFHRVIKLLFRAHKFSLHPEWVEVPESLRVLLLPSNKEREALEKAFGRIHTFLARGHYLRHARKRVFRSTPMPSRKLPFINRPPVMRFGQRRPAFA